MAEPFQLFLLVTLLNGLALAIVFDPAHGAEKPEAAPWLLAGAALLSSCLAARGFRATPAAYPAVYLHVLAFIATAWVTQASAALPVRLPKTFLRLRQALPWAAAGSALLLYNGLLCRDPWPATLALCLAMSTAMPVVQAIVVPLRQRLSLAQVPHRLRGLPVAACTCAVFALACLGFAGSLPW